MARHKVAEAARLVGKDRKSIYRHIKQGKLSSYIGSDGEKYIDTAELIRVYGQIETPETLDETPSISQNETPETALLLRELIDVVKHQSEQLEAIKGELKNKPRLNHQVIEEVQPEPLQNEPPPEKHSHSDIIRRMKEKLTEKK